VLGSFHFNEKLVVASLKKNLKKNLILILVSHINKNEKKFKFNSSNK
jgi:hypothetical protein